MTQKQQLEAMLTLSKTLFAVEGNDVVLKQHFINDENYGETTFTFDDTGSLIEAALDAHGCRVCLEAGMKHCNSDHILFLSQEEQDKLIEDAE